MSGLTEVIDVRLPRLVANTTQAHLRAVGRDGLEGMALWAGRLEGSAFTIMDAIIPRQQGHRTQHGLAVSVPGDELHRINMELYRGKLRLIAQVHSHPGHAYHSETDDAYAITTALGSISIVIPDFAVRSFELDDCAAYRLADRPWWYFNSRPRWRKLPHSELASLIRIVD